MAQVLETFAFRRHGRTGRDYSQYLDGRIWKTEPGVDFDPAKRDSFRSGVVSAAARDGLKLRTSSTDDGGLVLQAYTPEGSP